MMCGPTWNSPPDAPGLEPIVQLMPRLSAAFEADCVCAASDAFLVLRAPFWRLSRLHRDHGSLCTFTSPLDSMT